LDLKDLSTHTAEDKPAAAREFVQSVFRVLRHVSDFPESGRMVPESKDPHIREIIRKPCRIIYTGSRTRSG
jgi:plasmid stabilization system protein ParE